MNKYPTTPKTDRTRTTSQRTPNAPGVSPDRSRIRLEDQRPVSLMPSSQVRAAVPATMPARAVRNEPPKGAVDALLNLSAPSTNSSKPFIKNPKTGMYGMTLDEMLRDAETGRRIGRTLRPPEVTGRKRSNQPFMVDPKNKNLGLLPGEEQVRKDQVQGSIGQYIRAQEAAALTRRQTATTEALMEMVENQERNQQEHARWKAEVPEFGFPSGMPQQSCYTKVDVNGRPIGPNYFCLNPPSHRILERSRSSTSKTRRTRRHRKPKGKKGRGGYKKKRKTRRKRRIKRRKRRKTRKRRRR